MDAPPSTPDPKGESPELPVVVPDPEVKPAEPEVAPPELEVKPAGAEVKAEAPAEAKPTETWKEVFKAHGPITLLLVFGAALRSFRLAVEPGALIGDESWYVQAARVIAGLPVIPYHLRPTARSFLDPNTEHPPLAKVIMSVMLRAMGNKEIAWRLPSVVLGTLSIWLVYAIVRRVNGTRSQALVAAFVVALDNLCVVHGRIATLDIYFVTFMLVGTLLWVSSYLELGAIMFGVATVCKTNAVLGLVAMFLYDAILVCPRSRAEWRMPTWAGLQRHVLVGCLYLGFSLTALGALDCFFTEFTGPIAHLKHMGSFHKGLTSHGEPSGTHSIPFQWFLDLGTFNYYNIRVAHKGVVTKMYLFSSAMNQYALFLAPLALLFAGIQAWKERSKQGAVAVSIFLGNFLPVFLAWAVMSRTSYFYYMLPFIPGMAIAIGFASGYVPVKLRWGFVALMLYAAVYQYPVRSW